MYHLFARPLLFLFDPEWIHNYLMRLLRWAAGLPIKKKAWRALYSFEHPALEREVFGLKFRNPVGLAAGFDKNAENLEVLGAFGFGFIEIGTVTPKPQSGNPKPRIFRLKQDQGLINRMGFNNDGVHVIAERLRQRHRNMIVGGNIGKNKSTPNENAIQDYELCFKILYPVVDYFVVNVSSPNTPGLRELQEREPLTQLLTQLQKLNQSTSHRRPLLLKIAPDLTNAQLDDIVSIAQAVGLDGLIATNTTISREGLSAKAQTISEIGEGGLSGRPLSKRSTEVIRYLHQKSGGNIPIIGVGGIHSAEDALEKIRAGASLIQIYTGWIYEGPALVKKINERLAKESGG